MPLYAITFNYMRQTFHVQADEEEEAFELATDAAETAVGTYEIDEIAEEDLSPLDREHIIRAEEADTP